MLHLIALGTIVGVLAPAAAATPSVQSTSSCAPAVGFTGTICVPSGAGKHPALLLLGGSEGGDSLAADARAYAESGYVATSVAYFGLPGLPQTLERIPVETVGTALGIIEKRGDVDPSRIAILGISKGGEFALLAAATYPHIHAVVGDVPSPFAWQSIPNGPTATTESSWTVAGVPVPFVAYAPSFGQVFASAYATRAPLVMRPGYDASMLDRAAIDRAFFPLEKINGPVLFMSAGDDQIWNSEVQARMGLTYLQAKHHPFADALQNYPGAGHIFLFATPARPFVDTPFGGGLTLALGGTPTANVDAATDASQRITSFLTAAFAKPR